MQGASQLLSMVRGLGKRNKPANSAWTPILLYHRFDSRQVLSPWTILTGQFETQVKWLKRNFTVVPLRRVLDCPAGDDCPSPIAITADDGDESVYTQMFPVVQRYGIPVTLFVCPYSISLSKTALTWRQLRHMVESGLVDVQFHTLTHPNFHYERNRRTPGDYRAFVEFELTQGRAELQQRLGTRIDLLAWPYGICDVELENSAQELGYTAAFAVKPKIPSTSRFAIPRISVGSRHTIDRLAVDAGLGMPA